MTSARVILNCSAAQDNIWAIVTIDYHHDRPGHWSEGTWISPYVRRSWKLASDLTLAGIQLRQRLALFNLDAFDVEIIHLH